MSGSSKVHPFPYKNGSDMASNLSNLITDCIKLLASALNTRDLLSLGLVCKAFYHDSLEIFANTCLQTVTTDLSVTSLEALHSLSDNAVLRPRVKALAINVGSDKLGRGFRWRRHETGYIIQPATVFRPFRDLLLSSLTRCRSFHFLGTVEIGTIIDEKTILTPTDSVAIMLAIIAETALSIRAFRIDFPSQDGTVWNSSCLNSVYVRTNEFGWVWSSLKDLSLQIPLTQDNFRSMRGLTCLAKYLQHLRLDLKMRDAELFCDLLPANCCCHLEELRLTRIEVTVDALSEFLLRSVKSLRLLVLEECSVHGDRACLSILRLLRSGFSQLREIAIRSLRNVAGNQRNLMVFPSLEKSLLHFEIESQPHELVNGKGTRHQDLIVGARYQGYGMGQALATLYALLDNVPDAPQAST